MSEKWYQSENPDRWARHIGLWVAGIFAIVLVLSAAGWGIEVGISHLRGQGNAIIQKNSAQNFIAQQAAFQRNYQTIQSLDARLTDAQKALDQWNAQHPGYKPQAGYDPAYEQYTNLQTTFTGIQQQCRIAVQDYNAAARSFISQDFRDADLPVQIDATDHATDCSVTPDEEAAK